MRTEWWLSLTLDSMQKALLVILCQQLHDLISRGAYI